MEKLTPDQGVVKVRLERDSAHINPEFCQKASMRSIKGNHHKTYEKATE